MTEIDKLYELAGVEPDCTYLFLVDGNGENEAARTISIGSKADLKRLIVDCGVKGKVIKSTNTLKPFYPPFTAEKQIELIKWLAINNDIDYCKYYHQEIKNVWVFICVTLTELASEAPKVYGDYKEDFEQALAGLINNLWQDLTEEEKQQIKEILE